MRLLKVVSTVIVAILAVLVGLFTAIAVTAGGAVVYFARRLFGRSQPAHLREQPRSSSRSSNAGDVIDVTVTEISEVSADPATR